MTKEKSQQPCEISLQLHPTTLAIIQKTAAHVGTSPEDLLILGGYKLSRGLLDDHPPFRSLPPSPEETAMSSSRFTDPIDGAFFAEYQDKPKDIIASHEVEIGAARAIDPEWFEFYEKTFDTQVSATSLARLLKHAPTPYTRGLMMAKLFAFLEVDLVLDQVNRLQKSVGQWLQFHLKSFKDDPDPFINILNAMIADESKSMTTKGVHHGS